LLPGAVTYVAPSLIAGCVIIASGVFSFLLLFSWRENPTPTPF